MIDKEQIQEVISEYDGKLEELQEKYNKEVLDIENDTRFKEEAKKEEIQQSWEIYKKVENKVKSEQRDKAIDLLTQRREKAVEEFEKLKNKSINDSDLTEKDIAYVSGMLLNADDETLKNIAKQYDYNIHILNLINSRDSNIADFTKEGKLSDKLVIQHPLELIRNERLSENYPSQFDFNSAIPQVKPFNSLWD